MTGRYTWLEFVYTPWFEASMKGLLDDEGMRAIEESLVAHPRAGDVVSALRHLAQLLRDAP